MVPATALLSPASVNDEALAGETAAGVEVAVSSVGVAVSVSVTVCAPAVFSVTLNAWVPCVGSDEGVVCRQDRLRI